MKQINFIAGLPRSGSTLLCNVLNQHPDVYANSTSPLPFFVNNLINSQNKSVEFKNYLDKFPKRTRSQVQKSIQSFVQTWNEQYGKDYIFDKSRAWTHMSEIVRDINPDAKIIICIRDLKDVFASVIKQDQKNGLIGGTSHIKHKFDECFSPQGLIGGPYNGIMNLISQKPKQNIIYLKYELFMNNPKQTMDELYKFLNIPHFEHDFSKPVENTSFDCDGFYLDKFPHQGCGIVRPSKSDYSDWIPAWCSEQIDKEARIYNKFFNY